MPHTVVEVPKLELVKYAGEYRLDSAINLAVSIEQDHLIISVTGQNGGKMFPVGVNQFETQDRRVFAKFSENADALTIRQHGIDRIAVKAV